MAITIIGLGPGDASQLSREAWDVIVSVDTLFLRTEQHPVVPNLPENLEIRSFDALYESVEDFDELYRQIAMSIVEHGKTDQEVVYCVPGHPSVGESTVPLIMDLARASGIDVRVIHGISFLEPVLTALNVDALDGLQLYDAVQIAALNYPPINTDIPLLLGQVYNRFLASEIKIALMTLYSDDHDVVLLHAAGAKNQLLEHLHLHEIDRSENISHLTSLYVPAAAQPRSLPSFAETVMFLRGPDGCPWDQEQTRHSLQQDFMEEMAEVLEAIESDDPSAIKEELGDLLYHLVMQATIASELGEFTLSEVIEGINTKLIRRHPHIWGDEEVEGTAEVLHNWEQLKAEEKALRGAQPSVLDQITPTLSALAQSQSIQTAVKTIGFDWPSIDGVIAKVEEELSELIDASEEGRIFDEIGDLLFAIVNWGRWLGLDTDSALREANIRFVRRFKSMEIIASRQNRNLGSLNLQELDELWEQAKIQISDHSQHNELGSREKGRS